MKIFKNEINDGLNLDNCAIQASCKLIKELPANTESRIKKDFLSTAIAAATESIDLYYLYTILVSVGWNKNDDVFEALEVWNAKDTPIDKPFNFEHEPSVIIGHITKSWIVDDELNIIDDIENLPEEFHILTSAVIYTHPDNRDPELTEKIQKLISEIENGDWFVSMECIFRGFDYAVKIDNNQYILSRNEKTSFLTKYLKAYGGEGVYDGRKVGRLLRKITFSGKGLVKNPANPDSVIITDKFQGIVANINEVFSMNEDKIAQLEKDLAEATAQVADLTAKLAQIDKSKYETEIAELREAITKKDEVIATANKSLDEAKVNLDAVAKKVAEVEASKAELENQLTQIKANALKASRIAALVAASCSEEEATKLVEKFGSLADEQFEEIVLLAKKKMDEEGKKKCEAEDKTEDKTGEAAAEATNLDKVVVEDDAALASANDDLAKKAENVRLAIASFLTQKMNIKSEEK